MVLDSPAVKGWLERGSPSSREPRLSRLEAFLEWLHGQPGWSDATPESLLAHQENANGRGRFDLLNLIQRHVSEKGGARSGMISRYTAIRSFFLHNRVELPRDMWDPGAGTREATRGRLTVESVTQIVRAASLRDRAVFLTIFQGLMDQERFSHFNVSHAEVLVKHLKEHGPAKPLRIDFRKGRKRNYKPFLTFIGRDALQAWKEYFDKERGWPKPKEPLAVVRGTSRPIPKRSIRNAFETLCVRFKLREKRPGHGDSGHRTGINIHEFRDVARSHLQTAKGEGLDEKVVEFWMGHNVDPLAYLKFAELEPRYVEKNYRIAERYLNVLSNPLESEQVQQQDERIKGLEKQLQDLRQMITAGIAQLDTKSRTD